MRWMMMMMREEEDLESMLYRKRCEGNFVETSYTIVSCAHTKCVLIAISKPTIVI